MSEHPDFIKVVRMLRSERDLGFQEAKDQAIAMFTKRGWPHPFAPRSTGETESPTLDVNHE